MARKVVLAYSGGLDTSVAVRWMHEEWGVDVHCVAVDVGQTPQARPRGQRRARRTARSRRARRAARSSTRAARWPRGSARPRSSPTPATRASTPSSRRSRARSSSEHLVAEARRVGADAVAHGCTGKGNDQVRFEVGVRALAPDLEVLAPARRWGMTRADSVAYAAKWSIPIEATAEKIYSIDENLWGRAIECGAIEDPWAAPPEEPYTLTQADRARRRDVHDRLRAGAARRARRRGDGPRDAHRERSRRSRARAGSAASTWSRAVASGSSPARSTSAPARSRCSPRTPTSRTSRLERDVHHEKARLEPRWAELVYDGHVVLAAQAGARRVLRRDPAPRDGRGAAHASPPPGVLRVVGRRSPVALYDHGLATYDAADTFRHDDAEGFVRLWGLGVRTWAQRQGVADDGRAPTT